VAALTLAASMLVLPPSARADERGRDVEALMADYTALWSAKDAHAIWSRIYRLDAGQNFHSEADLAAEFARLTAQGYDHSDLQTVRACLLTPKAALAVLRFSRLKADGTVLPPKDRASAYLLRHGFTEVYHLKGGILRYLEGVPEQESRWRGECFVFDERVALGHGLRERQTGGSNE